jgi:hypothetical protein
MSEEKTLYKQGIEQGDKKDVKEDSERTQLPSIVPTLKQIANNHTGKLSDKWEAYYDVYESIFSEYRKEPVSVLEIGIQNGGFLEILSLYFWNAKAIGVEFNYEWYGLPDHRSYRVNFDKIREVLGFYPDYIIEDGAREIYNALKSGELNPDDPTTITVEWYKKLISEGVMV